MKKLAICAFIVLTALCIMCVSGCDGNKKPYAEAMALMDAGEFTTAAEQFEALGDYESAADHALCCRAAATGAAGDYDAAIEALIALDGAGDSGRYIAYFTARAYEDEARGGYARAYTDACRIYAVTPGLLDADERREALENEALVKTAGAIYDFSEGYARFEAGGLYGFIDASGNIVVEPCWEAAGDFSDGFAAVSRDGKWGYIDAAGGVVIEPEWDECGPFSEDRAAVAIRNAEDKLVYGYIDKLGNVIVEYAYITAKPFSEGFARVHDGEVWRFIDEAGNAVGDAYEAANDYSEGMAAVCVEGRWGFIDASGALAIQPKWDKAGGFSEGFAWVETGTLVGYIDTTGEYVVTPQCSFATDFSEGFAHTRQYEAVCYFDTAGEMVYRSKDWTYAYPFSCGRALVVNGDRYGYIDTEFGVAVDAVYNNAGSFSDGVAPVYANGIWSIIDVDGNVIF